MILDKEKYKNYHCDQWRDEETPADEIQTISLGDLYMYLRNAIRTAELNHIDPHDVPVFICTDNHNNSRYCVSETSECYGRLGMTFEIGTSTEGKYNQRLYYIAPDERPEEGEYWTSRGVGYDLSGFVRSKLAGERLLRMVKYVLETDKPKSWLDYRESEPNWIQFKFREEEFDLKKLDALATANHNILTIDILKQCKIINHENN